MEDNLEWVWIDTCCIDKSSSAELSEAINSMFRWYQNAAICYVYLVDVSVGIDSSDTENRLAHSRWFTRGWTLQELLAPTDIVFYSTDWNIIGKKSELLEVLSKITSIEEVFLQGRELQYASISKRMSWAAKRNTSRVEDTAYCLLGIFDINMPLIYGEGKKAFQRLQIELIRTNPYDHTLYAWGVVVSESSLIHPYREELPPWNRSNSLRRLLGPLAESPRDFEFSGSFLPCDLAREIYAFQRIKRTRLPTPVGSAVQLELPVFHASSVYHWSQVKITQVRDSLIAILFCISTKNTMQCIGIPLQAWGASCWGRTLEITVKDLPGGLLSVLNKTRMIHLEAEQPTLLKNGDTIFRSLVSQYNSYPRMCRLTYWVSGERVVRNFSYEEPFGLWFQVKNVGQNQLNDFRVVFHRLPDETLSLGKLAVWITLSRNTMAQDKTLVDHNGVPIASLDIPAEKAVEISSFLRAKKSQYYHIMEPVADSWVLDIEAFPKISIKVERKPIETGREAGFVDVVDMILRARDTTEILSNSKE